MPSSSYKCASSNNDGSNEFLNNGFAVASEVDDPEDEVPGQGSLLPQWEQRGHQRQIITISYGKAVQPPLTLNCSRNLDCRVKNIM
jgi:hypothetical protein